MGTGPKGKNAIPSLPPPRRSGGRAVMDAFAERRTIREIAPTPLPDQLLSDLLWAAAGVNRETGPFNMPGLTAASASDSQEIAIFALFERGAGKFDARAHALRPIATDDLRPHAMTQRQGVTSHAPVQLVLVADIDRLEKTQGFDEPGLHDPETQMGYAWFDAGLVAANVYLFAAANRLAAWLHNCDRKALTVALSLKPAQQPLYALSVGYPLHG